MSVITAHSNSQNAIIFAICFPNRISSHKLMKGRTGKPKPVTVKMIIQPELISSRGISFSCNIMSSYSNIIFIAGHRMSFLMLSWFINRPTPHKENQPSSCHSCISDILHKTCVRTTLPKF